MEKQNKEKQDVQGTEAKEKEFNMETKEQFEKSNAKIVQSEAKRTVRSPLYIIKVFGEHVKKVEEAGLLPKKEIDELKVLHQKMIQYFMGEPML